MVERVSGAAGDAMAAFPVLALSHPVSGQM
jgi:hypothetical protein